MRARQGEPVRLRIDGIAAGGAGVGRAADGRVVFVHRTAPGDEVEVAITESRTRWARGRRLRVLAPGPDRRDAPCPHYDRCGGCTLEHLTYAAQLRAKSVVVADALRRIGAIDLPAPDIVAAPQEFRYRNRVSFRLLRLPGGVVAGFHELERPARVLDIDGACLLPEPAVAAAWDALRAGWGRNAQHLPSGAELRLTLRAVHDGGVTLLVEGGHAAGDAPTLMARVPQLLAVWHRHRPDGPIVPLAGRVQVPERWQELELSVQGTLFLQTNRAVAALLDAHVLHLAGDSPGRVVDVYSGAGIHARRLAERGARVTAIELDPAAVAAARSHLPPVVDLRQGRAEDLLPATLPADLVLLNPPRAGLGDGMAAALRAVPPARIIYISCDPATLARDLRRLAPRFALRSIRCFDMFPQTAHVETVVELQCSTT